MFMVAILDILIGLEVVGGVLHNKTTQCTSHA